MANIKSAIKRIKISRRNEAKNKTVKSALRSAVRKAKSLIGLKKDEAQKAVLEAIKKIDKSVSKGVVHKKTASRKKSRLMKLFNKSKAV
ncbi:MAG: 30S ribosomal protein S20 [Candidatus Saganbacteria bacterium]|nr:30S ribosomal protein S20 [Candidatus Saganbacteria bacterium]